MFPKNNKYTMKDVYFSVYNEETGEYSKPQKWKGCQEITLSESPIIYFQVKLVELLKLIARTIRKEKDND